MGRTLLKRRVPPREVVIVVDDLVTISRIAARLATEIEDLYWVAHDRPTKNDSAGRGRADGYVQLAPNRPAWELWAEISGKRGIRAMGTMLVRWASRADAILGDGELPDPRCRPGRPIRDAELRAALAAQQRRREAGEYVPVTRVAQPGPVRR